MKESPDCIHRIELDTELSIRSLCREYGISAAYYFELSNMNAPHHDRAMSYSRFAQAMSGLPISEEHVDMLAFSLLTVRQELRRAGTEQLAKDLPKRLSRVMAAWDNDPDLLTKAELTTLRRILRRAEARIQGTT